MRDLKYLFAYTVPLSAYISFESFGLGTYTAVLYAFVILPLLDVLTGKTATNLSAEQTQHKKANKIFDWMLYVNLPIVFGLLYVVFSKIMTTDYTTSEYVGLALSTGILLATNGINVAHELGHRKSLIERLMSKALFMPCLYMHFYIEHNFGHHFKVVTPDDGATARYNQSVYAFWIRSVSKQYVDAWKKQLELLINQEQNFFSWKNDMLYYHLIQPLYLGVVFLWFSTHVMLFALLVGIISFLFLECINYIEHYGLRRLKTPSGRYERVQTHHSWNSNHNIGRIVLYELTRHSDHHFKSAKKYQILNSYQDSPHLPLGYPASILLSLLPPLWFWVMNPLVPQNMKPQQLD
ncbi:MAG: alkane 1-monooxygenase [Flavobacteriaceae bacterium]